MRIAILGAGGVGGYFGARLQQAGHSVAFIARGRHLQALQRNGLALKSPLGDAQLKVKAVEKPADAGAVDVVMFTVKLWDTESAAAQLRPVVGGNTFVIPFQNGVESIERIGAVLGRERVMGGAAYIASRIAEPGAIVQTGQMARLRFGTVFELQRKAAELFLGACREAKIDAELVDDIVRVLWEKFVLLVALSATTTVTRKPIGVVRSDPARHARRAGKRGRRKARRAPCRAAARRRGGLRHPGRDRPHAAAAPVSLHAHHRSAPVLEAADAKHPPAGDHLQGARQPG